MAVDQPLEVRTDPNSGKDYLLCDYNRDGDSYRYTKDCHVSAARLVPRSSFFISPPQFSSPVSLITSSPWSNEYDPPLDYDATFPSDSLRALELKANQVFDTYRDLYYEGGVSSVYTWVRLIIIVVSVLSVAIRRGRATGLVGWVLGWVGWVLSSKKSYLLFPPCRP